MEHLQALAKSTKIINDISVRSISTSYEEPGDHRQLTEVIRDVLLGDPIAEQVENLLALHAPYLGDDLEKEGPFSGQQFVIYRTLDTHHIITDAAWRLEEDLMVPSDLLRNSKFLLGDWYTTHLVKRYNMSKCLVCLMHNGEPMGDPISRRVSKILNSECNFPGVNSPKQFICV
ncbi:hypothetical protein DFH29DRAFT_804476 [Suillus ampliporus]|nr:hypothetical protein DFH29DRAFT_804476 [Suillus ampliporus]